MYREPLKRDSVEVNITKNNPRVYKADTQGLLSI